MELDSDWSAAGFPHTSSSVVTCVVDERGWSLGMEAVGEPREEAGGCFAFGPGERTTGRAVCSIAVNIRALTGGFAPPPDPAEGPDEGVGARAGGV
jgi:hypothetical protein